MVGLMATLPIASSGVSDFSSPVQEYATDIEEAKALVRRCAEPCPAGDSVKEAIKRASNKTGIAFSRTQDFWYGEAARIDAKEMDKLRAVADAAELDMAICAIQALHRRASRSHSASSREVMHRLDDCLRILGGGSGRIAAGRKARR